MEDQNLQKTDRLAMHLAAEKAASTNQRGVRSGSSEQWQTGCHCLKRPRRHCRARIGPVVLHGAI